MTTEHWSKPIIAAVLTELQRGSTRVTVYLNHHDFSIETTTPRPGDPGYLIHFHADALLKPTTPFLLHLLLHRLQKRIKAGTIAANPTHQINGE